MYVCFAKVRYNVTAASRIMKREFVKMSSAANERKGINILPRNCNVYYNESQITADI